VISTIDASPGQYDTTTDAVIGLEHAGVSDRVIAAMRSKGSYAVVKSKGSYAVVPVINAAPRASAQTVLPPAPPVPSPVTDTPPAQASAATKVPSGMVMLRDGTDVSLKFDESLSSKSAAEGDPVTFILDEDLKVGDVVVAKSGSKAVGEVSNAKKSEMMGKAGELNVRLDYLKVGDFKVKLRGTKDREGESGTTATVVLTVLFGPIGLIKHGHNINIPQGTALKAYVADDIALPPAP
jgi:hypothetical protein